MERDKFCPIRNRHVCQARRAVEQREFRGGAARVKRFAKDRGVAPGLLGFISGAYSETQRVVWPTRAETVQTTLVVLVMVMVVGVALWLLDMVLLWAIQILTGQGG
jgi:preprotein translocase subunit SecE